MTTFYTKPITKCFLKALLIFTVTVLGILPIVSNAQSHCRVDAINFIDEGYDSECEGAGAVFTVVLFGGQSGTYTWSRLGVQPMPSAAYTINDQLYINPYYNKDQGDYRVVFTSNTNGTNGCTDTMVFTTDFLVAEVKPQIKWVKDLCGQVLMKAINVNDTTANHNTYSWMDQFGNFTINSQTIATNHLTETVKIVSVGTTCSNTLFDYMPTSQMKPPITPAAITVTGGSPSICTGNIRTYTVTPQNSVSYNWSVPTGAVITTGQGTNSIKVTYNSSFTTGSIAVAVSNLCGSVSRNIAITKATPPIPGTITGVVAGLCGATNYTYSVTAVAGITYQWTCPAGTTILSGQGSNSITVSFPVSNFTAPITVTATNTCGTSAPRSLTVRAAPVTPSPITGNTTVCSGSTGNVYSIGAVASATNYTWTGPTGSHITANGTTSVSNVLTVAATSVSIQFGTVTASSQIKVKANNNCVGSSLRTLTLSPCLPRLADQQLEKNQLAAYPNPVKGQLTIQFNTEKEQNARFVIADVMGRIMIEKEVSTPMGLNQYLIDLAQLSAGYYVLNLITTDGNQAIQIVKE